MMKGLFSNQCLEKQEKYTITPNEKDIVAELNNDS